MTPTTHPRVLARGTRIHERGEITQVIERMVIYVLVYAPTMDRREWVERELKVGTTMQVVHGVKELVATLVEDFRARPQILVIDLDALSAGELFHLHQIRERGWCGEIIALGHVPPSLRASLQITRVLRPPFVERALADELVKYRSATEETTMQIPIISQDPTGPEHKTYG